MTLTSENRQINEFVAHQTTVFYTNLLEDIHRLYPHMPLWQIGVHISVELLDSSYAILCEATQDPKRSAETLKNFITIRESQINDSKYAGIFRNVPEA